MIAFSSLVLSVKKKKRKVIKNKEGRKKIEEKKGERSEAKIGKEKNSGVEKRVKGRKGRENTT